MKFRSGFLIGVLLFACAVMAEAPRPGHNKVSVRGQIQDVYYFPGAGIGPHPKVLFFPGDGGWHGFAETIAHYLSADGYDVFGVDTRHYLQSFADSKLNTSEIASDYRSLATWIRQGTSGRILLIGWSEGAGLGLAAAADPQNRSVFEGFIAIGMTDQNILAWRWSDAWAEIAKKVPHEPTFASADYVGRVSPLPLFMIASTNDEYVTQLQTRTLFADAHEPKKLAMVDASNHKYGGNTEAFFRTLKEGLGWITQQHR